MTVFNFRLVQWLEMLYAKMLCLLLLPPLRRLSRAGWNLQKLNSSVRDATERAQFSPAFPSWCTSSPIPFGRRQTDTRCSPQRLRTAPTRPGPGTPEEHQHTRTRSSDEKHAGEKHKLGLACVCALSTVQPYSSMAFAFFF